jgi:hypothetical protein
MSSARLRDSLGAEKPEISIDIPGRPVKLTHSRPRAMSRAKSGPPSPGDVDARTASRLLGASADIALGARCRGSHPGSHHPGQGSRRPGRTPLAWPPSGPDRHPRGAGKGGSAPAGGPRGCGCRALAPGHASGA